MDYWKIIKNVMKYVDENIRDDLSIKILAEHAGYSEYHFSRMFKTHTGMSPMDYVRRRKLVHAILEEDKNLLEVAMDYGFQTQTGFIKAFKKIYDLTPSKYRMNVLNTGANGRMIVFERIGKRKIMDIKNVSDNVLEKALVVADKVFNLTANGIGKYSYDFWRENFLKNPELMIISEDNEKITGFMFGWVNGNTVTLSYDWVEERLMDGGLKDSLLEYFEKQVAGLGYGRIALGVMPESEEFYLANGYEGCLLVQSASESLDELEAVAKGYRIINKQVYEGGVNQVYVDVDAESKGILMEKYQRQLTECNTIMVYWKNI